MELGCIVRSIVPRTKIYFFYDAVIKYLKISFMIGRSLKAGFPFAQKSYFFWVFKNLKIFWCVDQ